MYWSPKLGVIGPFMLKKVVWPWDIGLHEIYISLSKSVVRQENNS